MEISNQIKKYRNDIGYSQDELAEKIFVSRQTISNWENGKSYPDIKSLLMLSNIFDISLDSLVKGDVAEMKRIIEDSDLHTFKRNNNIYLALLGFVICFSGPVYMLGNPILFAIQVAIIILCIYYAIKVDKQMKKLDIHTYKEVVAFTEKRALTESEKSEERGKAIYQKIFMVLTVMLFSLLFSYVTTYFLKKYM